MAERHYRPQPCVPKASTLALAQAQAQMRLSLDSRTGGRGGVVRISFISIGSPGYAMRVSR